MNTIVKKVFKEQFHVILLIVAVLLLMVIFPVGISKKNPGFVTIVDYGNGVKRKFVGATRDNMSAWDTLQQAAAHSYVTVETMKDFYPKAIDSWEDGKNGKHWILYLNNEKVLERPIDVKINSGDTVVWRFE